MPPTFDNVRQCLAPVWKDEEFKRDILWAGVFGSVARNRAREDSDVDVLIVLKEHLHSPGEPVELRERLAEACAREVSLVCIWQGIDWAWGMIRVEALLSSRTVYGKREDIEHLRQDSMTILKDGLIRFNNMANAVEKLKKCITAAQTFENFIQPSHQSVREECILQLGQVAELLDMPLHHPLCTILVYYVFDQVDPIRTLLAQADFNATILEGWNVADRWETFCVLLQWLVLTWHARGFGFVVAEVEGGTRNSWMGQYLALRDGWSWARVGLPVSSRREAGEIFGDTYCDPKKARGDHIPRASVEAYSTPPIHLPLLHIFHKLWRQRDSGTPGPHSLASVTWAKTHGSLRWEGFHPPLPSIFHKDPRISRGSKSSQSSISHLSTQFPQYLFSARYSATTRMKLASKSS
ncbi:hypothetical protein Agabi119p4_11095 [Agaricus bisporus var. burnettii]|uniref:Polymerase beta nucleotidyltransferase domain-containing protein n=1 Tax=Agaricus bisporus var. burnettii TaxID=192524 RepID=A0A8H7EVU1_AGABI|nr:hypothetical protein Agabi119p4_11095 [Agaricus bisporus var. burnettii]